MNSIKLLSSSMIILIVPLFLSCEILNFHNNDSVSELQPGESLEATIGSEGGELETTDFNLTIPSGAFNSPVNLKLYKETENNFSETSVSNTFKIEGLPLSFSSPIQIRIKYSGTLVNESFIAVSESGFVRSAGKSKTTHNLFEAENSDGYLSCNIPAPELPNMGDLPSSDKTISVTATAITNGSIYPTAGSSKSNNDYHFLIKVAVPDVNAENTLVLLNKLEESYLFIKDVMSFSYSKRTNWPVEVNVLKMNNYGNYVDSWWGLNYGYLEINSEELPNHETIGATAGHEFFHLVQSLYDPRSTYAKKDDENYDHYWVDEASAVYIEGFFTEEQDSYLSTVVDGYQMAPFNGMQKGAIGNGQNHGYGMSSLFKYFDKYYSLLSFKDIYLEILDEKHPIRAIELSTESPWNWFQDYIMEYVSLVLPTYSVSNTYWRLNMYGSFTIDDANDTEFSFTDKYPALSARLYNIPINYSEMGKDSELEFKITGDGVPQISVFKWRVGTVEFL